MPANGSASDTQPRSATGARPATPPGAECIRHMNEGIAQQDPLIAEALAGERGRQQEQIELIASENTVSRAVLDALGHTVTNKALEGYPRRPLSRRRALRRRDRAGGDRARMRAVRLRIRKRAAALRQPGQSCRVLRAGPPRRPGAQSRPRGRRPLEPRAAFEPVRPLIRGPPLRCLTRNRHDRLRRCRSEGPGGAAADPDRRRIRWALSCWPPSQLGTEVVDQRLQ